MLRAYRRIRFLAGALGLALVISALPLLAHHSSALLPDATAETVAAPGEYKTLPLTRIMDTRSGLGGRTGALLGGQTVNLTVLGVGGVPTTGVQAVALSIDAVTPTASGWLTAWPAGQARPLAATVGAHTQGSSSSLTVIPTGTNGQVSIYLNTGSANILVEVAGYVTSTAATSAATTFVPLTPARVFDTRNGTGGITGTVGAGATVSFAVTGVGGVPATGVTAVAINIGATGATADAFIKAWPAGATAPAPQVMYSVTEGSSQTMAIVPVGTGGKISLYNSTGTVYLFGDVLGYYLDQAAAGSADLFVPIPSSRILDTRNAIGVTTGALGAAQTVSFPARGVGGIPTTRVSAIAMTLSTTGATAGTHLIAWANGTTRPATSTIQARVGVNLSNLVFIPVGADGRIALYNNGGSVHAIGDVIGYLSDNNPPPAVDRRSMTPGDSADAGSTTPTLHARFTDPDADQGYAAYEVVNPATGAVAASGRGPTVASGTDSAWTVPAGTLAAGATYRWRTRSVDAKGGASAWSSYKYFNTQNASLTGEQRRFSFEERKLTDRLELKANVANGNLLLHATDLQIRGTGIDLTVDRYYNSRLVNVSTLGKGWTLGIGQDVQLIPAATNPTTSDVTFVAPSGFTARFSYDSSSSGWRHPPGVDAGLTWNATSSEWKLQFHKTEGRFFFNSGGRYLRQEDRNNNKISYGYNAAGQLSSVTDTQGRVITFGYVNNRLDTITDPTGRTVRYTYDAAGNLETVTDPAGAVVRYRYNGDLVDQVTTGGNAFTRIDYVADTSRRVLGLFTQFDPGNGVPTNATTSFSYGSGETKVTDPNGNNTTGDTTDGITTYRYDDRDRVTKVIDALGHTRDKQYTSNDNVSTLTDALQKQVTMAWDPNDENLTSVSLPTGAKSTLDYTNTAHPHAVSKSTDPQGNTMAYSYDSAGNETAKESSQYPGTKIEQKFYNSDGTVDYILDGNGTKTDYSYDAKGNLTLVDNPAPLGDITLTPDALSRLRTQVDGRNQTTTRTYDPIDRPDVLTFAGGSTVDYDYDLDGNQIKVTDPTGITVYDYNKINRQIRKTTPDNTQIRYEYDHNGNLTELSDSGGTTTYGYNQVNLLASLLEPGAGTAVTFGYDDDNQRTRVTYPTSPQTNVTLTYDDSGRQKTIKAVAGTSTLTDVSYSYTKNGADTGLRQTMTDPSGTVTYGYDGLNRLTSATGAQSRSYAYDIDFNRTSKTVAGGTTNYGYNAPNQLTTVNGTATYNYDGNGNLTGGGGWSLGYNSKEQTTTITKPGGTALSPLVYAGQDQTERRQAGDVQYATTVLGVSRATTPDTGGFTTLLLDSDASKPVKGSSDYYTRDSHGALISLRTGSARYYYLLDGLGSVIGLVSTAGVKVNSYSYDPYGEQVSVSQSVANPWRYASGQYDGQTGLTKFGARYYDTGLGRFTQRDPSGKDLPYAYAGCNPTNNTDPTGQDWWNPTDWNWGCIGAVVGTTAAVGGFVALSITTAGTANVFYAGALIAGAGTVAENLAFWSTAAGVLSGGIGIFGAC